MGNKDLKVEREEGGSSLTEPDIIRFYLNGKEVYSFYDNLYHHSEDAAWNRFLNELFFKGVEIGKELQRESD